MGCLFVVFVTVVCFVFLLIPDEINIQIVMQSHGKSFSDCSDLQKSTFFSLLVFVFLKVGLLNQASSAKMMCVSHDTSFAVF